MITILMAVKLSKYYWFRNNYLLRSLNDEDCENFFFNGRISPDDRRTLQFIIDELDELKENSHFQPIKPVISKKVFISEILELRDKTSNPESAAAYLGGIHKIMEKYWVLGELYNDLGKCYEEIKVQPPTDVAEAINFAMDQKKALYSSPYDRMCWSTIKEHKISQK